MKLSLFAAAGVVSVILGSCQGSEMTTEELDALARDFGYSRMGVGAWQPPPPPKAETVAAVVRIVPIGYGNLLSRLLLSQPYESCLL